MAGKITTLYVSDSSIKVLVISGKRIVKLAEVPLNMEAGDTSVPVQHAELVARIRHVFKANKLGATRVILGFSGLHCLSRPVTLPNLPWAMVGEAMLREAERVLPVSVSQLYVSWQVLSSSEEAMQAFMVAVPRQVADPLLTVMNEVGIKPFLMDIKPMALARLVPEPNAIMLDVQEKDFDVVILSGGIPQPIRSVPLPHGDLSLGEKLEIVKEEIRRTVQFYNEYYPEHPVDPGTTLYVSGEIDEGAELFEALESELGYRVALLMSPLKSAKNLDPSGYLVNVGLALKELTREAGPLLPNINILPEPYRPKRVSVSKVLALPAIGIAFAIIAVLGMTVQDAATRITMMQAELDTANRIVTQRQAQRQELNDTIAALEKDVTGLETQRGRFEQAYQSLGAEAAVLDDSLDAVVDNIFPNLNVEGITVSGKDGPNVSGWAQSEAEILKYARSLEDTGLFKEVVISTVDLQEEGEDSDNDGVPPYDFNVTALNAGQEE